MAVFRESDAVGRDRAAEDRRRHRQLVEDSIKKNLSDILSEESIIGEHKNRKIKVPIRGIKEYRFIYGRNVPKVGSGDGSEKRGDIIGNSGDVGRDSGIAGNQEGDDIYETEVTIEDIIDYLFEDFNLPRLDRKRLSQVSSEAVRKKAGYQRKGIPPRLAKKRSVIKRIKRKQSMKRTRKEEGIHKEIGRFPFREDDLKYYRMKKIEKRTLSAVIICIMDTSGSMDQTKKYYARSFFFLLYQFVRMKYYTVDVVFISHSTTAKVVNEVEFFHKVQSGGTYISSGYEKALEVIEKGYSPAAWNIYAFHASDGDNWSEDDSRAVEYAKKLCDVCNLFGYVEIGGLAYPTNIKGKFIDNIRSDNFAIAAIDKKEDIWPAFRSIINIDLKEG